MSRNVCTVCDLWKSTLPNTKFSDAKVTVDVK